MKKISVLVFVALAAVLFFVSCGPKVEERASPIEGWQYLITRTSKGSKWNIKNGSQVMKDGSKQLDADTIYTKWNDQIFFYKKNGKTYARERLGHALGGGLPIIRDDYIGSDKAAKYWGKMFYPGDYIRLHTEKGVSAVFIKNSSCGEFGPYKEILPGVGGFMYQDGESQKWGADAAQYYLHNFGTPVAAKKQKAAIPAEYDEVMEIVLSATKDIWAAREGATWYSFEDGKKVTGRKAAQNLQKIQAALKMPVRTQAVDGRYWPAQRVGIAGKASVAFMPGSFRN